MVHRVAAPLRGPPRHGRRARSRSRSTSNSARRPGADPSLDAALHRRLRIGAWIRIFLVGLERWLGPAEDGLSDEALGAMGARDATSRA